MAEGVDYSSARPDLPCLAAGGKQFVMRYFSIGPHAKNLTRTELNAILAAGMSAVLIFEENAGRPLSGRATGVADARSALDSWRALGLSSPCPPVYFCLDIDPNPLTSAQLAAVAAYIDGCAEGMGNRELVGFYGGYRAIELFVGTGTGKARWGFQTYAWSAGRWSEKAHVRQYRNGVDLCGGRVDLDTSMTPDFGQWPRPQEDDMPLTDADIPVIAKGVTQALDTQARKVYGIVNYERYLEVLLAAARDDGNVDIDETALADAVAAKVGAQLDPVVWAKAVAAALPADLARQFLAAFAAELND